MSVLNDLSNIQIPIEYLNKLLNIYKYIGKHDYYQLKMESRLSELEQQAINHNSLIICNYLKLNITDNRKQLIIYKNSEPKSQSEICLLNIKKALIKINQETKEDNNYNLNSSDLLEYLNTMSNHKITFITKNFSLRGERNTVRFFLNETLNLMRELFNQVSINSSNINSSNIKIEPILIISSTYLELSIIQGYSDYNELACVLLTYYLLLKTKIYYVKYFNFFELMLNDLNNIKSIVRKSTTNYEQDNIYLLSFYDYLLTLCNSLCEKMDDELLSFKKVERSQKGDLIEDAIKYQMGNNFTKKDLQDLFPNIALITIERVLTKFKDLNYIMPDGTGRSAKWIKLEPLLNLTEPIAKMNKNNKEDDN